MKDEEPPKLICLIGPDGVGKTTQAKLLIEKLREMGYDYEYRWMRFHHFVSLPVLALARLMGLTEVQTLPDGRKIGYHHFYRSRLISTLYPITLYIDTLLAMILRIYLPMKLLKKRIVCDRFVYDTLVDLAVDLDKPEFITSKTAKRFLRLLRLIPGECLTVLLVAPYDIIKDRRQDLKYDATLKKRIQIYASLSQYIKYYIEISRDDTITLVQKTIQKLIGLTNTDKSKQKLVVYHFYHFDYKYTGKGGAANYIISLLKRLQNNRNLKVALVGSKLPSKLINSNLKFHVKFIPISKGYTWWKYLISLFIWSARFSRQKNKKNCTLFHIHRIEYALPFILFNRDVPIVLTLHTERLAIASKKFGRIFFKGISVLYKYMENIAINRANAIISVSPSPIKSYVAAHGPALLSKTRIIPIGLNMAYRISAKNVKKRRNSYEIKILYAGVLEKHKNVIIIPDIIHDLVNNKNQKSIEMIIAGDGDEKKNILERSKYLGISRYIKFLGEIERDKMPEVYKKADIFLFPSFSESFAIVLLEATAYGLFIITTPRGIAPYLINKQNGIIIDNPTDIHSFSNAITRAISCLTPKFKRKLEILGQHKALIYNWEDFSQKILATYRKVPRDKNE